MSKKQTVSQQTIDEALKIAKGTARPGQTKDQTKLIAQGIEKGIAEYKKREKAKARERDKAKKKAVESGGETQIASQIETKNVNTTSPSWLPWGLLILSWIGFAVYVVLF